MMINIRKRTCDDCANSQPCKMYKAGWMLIKGAIVPYWGCKNIKLKDGTVTVEPIK